MAFSLAAVLDFCDTQPEPFVMAIVAQAFEEASGERGLFSSKFIPIEQIQALGYQGFKQTLISLYEIDPDFVEQNRHDLHAIVRKLKGEQ